MRHRWQALMALSLVSCSPGDRSGSGGVMGGIPEREETEATCPVHQVPVFKAYASGAISCHAWDPMLGLTVEQIRNRFPYAIWDSNLHHLDESPGTRFPAYYLLCDRCQDSWGEYAALHAPRRREARLEILVSPSGEAWIHGARFDLEHLAAMARTIAEINPDARVVLRADKSTPPEKVRSIAKALEEGGLENFTFGSYPPGRTFSQIPGPNASGTE